jgi:polysaccharide deacetylase 2 family uncharacterized protein YibQ
VKKRRHKIGDESRRRHPTSPRLALRGMLAWAAWRLRDAAKRLVASGRPQARRGYKALRLHQSSLQRQLTFLAVAMVLGVALGVMLGKREPARVAQHQPARPTVSKPAPAPKLAEKESARPSKKATVVPSAPRPSEVTQKPAPERVADLPAAPKPEAQRSETATPATTPPSPEPAETKTSAPPPAPPEPSKMGASREEPQVVYEETLPEPSEKPEPGLPGATERKPVVLGHLSSFTPPVIEGPTPLWLQNAVAMPDLRGRPMIALVIDDMGVDRKRSERAMHLPAAATFSFLPYAPDVARQAQEALSLGHEIIVHVPMEPENPNIDPGPHALRVGETPKEIRGNLDWDMSRLSGYVGINNHMGSRFTRNAEDMRVVLEDIKARGLFFLDSRTTGSTAGPRVAREIGLPHLERDVFLDNIDTRDEVTKRLAEVEHIARRDGYVVTIGHPHDATLEVLEKWTREVAARGFVLVPLSAAMRVRLAAEQMRPRAEAGSP